MTTKTEPKPQEAGAKPAGPTAIVARAPSKIGAFRGELEKMRSQLALAIPKHLDVDRMLRVIFTTVRRTPALLDCTSDSLLGCIFQCAQLGLEPDGLLGHAYLIPYMNNKVSPKRLECQLIVGYKGLIKLARQSGEIASISARVVHSKDTFEYEYGLNEKLRHIPYMPNGPKDDAGGTIFAYAIFRLKDGSYHFDVMGIQEIEWIREGSPSGKSPAWRDHYDEMCKKTVVRRAAKMSPASVDDRMARAITIDERADAGLPQQLEADDDDTPALGAMPGAEALPPAREGERGPLRRPATVAASAAPAASASTAAALAAAEQADQPEDKGDAPTESELAGAAGVEGAPWEK